MTTSNQYCPHCYSRLHVNPENGFQWCPDQIRCEYEATEQAEPPYDELQALLCLRQQTGEQIERYNAAILNLVEINEGYRKRIFEIRAQANG